MLKNMYSDQSFLGNVPFDSAWETGHSGLKVFTKQHFRLVQIESTCRQQKKCISKLLIWF